MRQWARSLRRAANLHLGQAGGHVKPGEKTSHVTFWKLPEGNTPSADQPEEGTEQCLVPIMRHYFVFHMAQCEGIAEPAQPDFIPIPHERLSWCEQVIRGMPLAPEIRHCHSSAYYSPAVDMVGIPDLERFRSAEDYHATLFHELAHSTEYGSRLDRTFATNPAPFGSPDHSREELVAELAREVNP